MHKDWYSLTTELSKIDEDYDVMNKIALFVTIRSIFVCIAAVNLWRSCRMAVSLLLWLSLNDIFCLWFKDQRLVLSSSSKGHWFSMNEDAPKYGKRNNQMENFSFPFPLISNFMFPAVRFYLFYDEITYVIYIQINTNIHSFSNFSFCLFGFSFSTQNRKRQTEVRRTNEKAGKSQWAGADIQ